MVLALCSLAKFVLFDPVIIDIISFDWTGALL